MELEVDYKEQNKEREVKLVDNINGGIDVLCLQPVTDLEMSQSQIFTLNVNEAKYFRIDISNYDKDDDYDKGIIVDLHRHFGNAYMVYHIYADQNLELPQLNSYTNRKYVSVHDATFVLTKQDINRVWNNKPYSSLYLLVAVFSYSYQQDPSNGMFTISYKLH